MYIKNTSFIFHLIGILPKKSIQVVILQVISGILEAFSVISLFPLLVIMLKGQFVPDGLFEELIFNFFSFFNMEVDIPIVLILLFFLVITKAFFSYYTGKTVGFTAASIGRKLRSRLYNSIILAEWLFIIDQKIGELNTALTNESGRASMAFLYFSHFISGVIITIVYLFFAFLISPVATTLAIISSFLFYLLINKTLSATKKSGRSITILLRNLGNTFVETLNGLKSIKAMSQETIVVKELDINNKKYENAQRVRITNKWILKSLQEPFIFFILALSFYILLNFLETKIEYIFILIFIFSRILTKINIILSNFQSILATQSAFDFIYKNISRAEKNKEVMKGNYISDKIEKIKFEDVELKYGDKVVINNINFKISRGEFITIKGLSGSGKTSIIDCLMGLNKPSKGKITFNEHNYINLDIKCLRENIGFVPQDIFLFNGTLKDNITMFAKSPDKTLIESVMQISGSKMFISKLKDGLNTNIGEKGQKFSGGERQRISLMRALYKEPRILILDEFSSALDISTANKIYRELKLLKTNKIIISISHDQNIKRYVDKTFIINDKTVSIENE
tara:strand:+ start:6526 stop:8232 length:1707 start_codon:yes stop_codon:yes gene_type:complete